MKDVKPMSARRAAVGLLWLAFGFVASPAAADDLTAEVVKQARARQEKVKSFDVKFVQTQIQPPGSIMAGKQGGPVIPKVRTTSTSENRVVVQGSCFHFEDNHPTSFRSVGPPGAGNRLARLTESWRKRSFRKGFPEMVTAWASFMRKAGTRWRSPRCSAP
jgi:hypothetical protein